MNAPETSPIAAGSDLLEHGLRSAQLSFLMAVVTGLSRSRRLGTVLGALLQNVGLVFGPIHPGFSLENDLDAQLLVSHPLAGAEFLRRSNQFEPELREQICAVVAAHHERLDGLGFPEGLAGDAIPVGARIVAIADAFARRVAHDPERRRVRLAALAALEPDAGKRFDPFYLAALRRLVETDLDLLACEFETLFGRDGVVRSTAREILREAGVEREREVGFLDSARTRSISQEEAS